MPSYSLPKLKVLFFSVYILSDHAFLPRLLASCPLLEDLLYQPFTEHVDRLIIQSISLRRLWLRMCKTSALESDNVDFVHIDTPNLEQFEYNDNLAHHYSIIMHSHCLVKADLFVWNMIEMEHELSFRQLINITAPLSHVQLLNLSGRILQEFNYADVNILKDQLPVFSNMKHLSLDGGFAQLFFDKILLPLLNCWPVLETLVLPEGIIDRRDRWHTYYPKEKLELEQKFLRRAHPIPSCCKYHLKTIVVKNYLGRQREYDFIQFFLCHTLVLENLVVHCFHQPQILAQDRISIENTLRSLPKASMNCSIQVL